MELLLIRHGLPARREDEDGPADPELAPRGHAQAEHMANHPSSERIPTIDESAHLGDAGLPTGRFQKG